MQLFLLQLLFLILLYSESDVDLSLWLEVTDIYLKVNDYKTYCDSLSNCVPADRSKVAQAKMFVGLKKILHFPFCLFFISLA